jgi:hypothetical protein
MLKKAAFLTIVSMCLITLTFVFPRASANTAAPLSPRSDASVSIDFDGIMAVCFGDPSQVGVGILNVPNHTPKVTITEISNNNKRVIAELADEQLSDLHIFTESHNNSINRFQSQDMSDPNDYRWTVDMENDLYQRQLSLNTKGMAAKIHIETGLFYADKLSERNFRFFAADNSGKELNFNRKIGFPAAKIALEAGDALILQSKDRTIRLNQDYGVKYEISIHNSPKPEMASMDHFLFYYDNIDTKVTPYSPVMAQKAAYSTNGSICLPAVFGRSRLN